jgi:4-oxalocrotonate tautomerase family enzyme
VPTVTVQMWTGRSVAQKRRLVRALTDAMVEHAGARPDALHVLLHEYSLENWARAGTLALDMPSEPSGASRTAAPVDTSESSPPPADAAQDRPQLHHLLLECADLDASVDFYVNAVGVEIRARQTHRDGRPLVLTHNGLGLTTRLNSEGHNVEHLAFAIESVAAIVERVPATAIVRGPGPGPYGHTVYLADPDRNEVECFERSGPTST